MSLVFMNRGRLKRTHARDARQCRPSVTTWSCISDRRGDTTITTGLLDVDIPVTRPVSQSAQNGNHTLVHGQHSRTARIYNVYVTRNARVETYAFQIWKVKSDWSDGHEY